MSTGDGSVARPPRQRLLFLVNVDWFFVSHRLTLAVAAEAAGYEVHVATRVTRPEAAQAIRDAGLELHHVEIGRGDSSLLYDARSILLIFNLLRRIRPDVLHNVAIKPVIFGGLVARLLRVRAVVQALPGLGSGLASGSLRRRLRRLLLLRALKLACGSGRTVVVLQNQEDIDTLRASGVAEASNIVLIRGSGVAVAGVPCMPEPPGPPRVILAARMIREKGIAEFVAAAAQLRSEGVKAEFLLAGAPDTGNPHSLTDEEIRTYTAAGEVVHLGHVDDVPKVFGSCHIVCLPTYYNEGVPKALIEAAAAGRPIVTTDQPGCRDIVVHGVNGLLVPARDVLALVRALRELIEDAGLRTRLGRAGRERAAREFDVSLVQAQTLSIYSKLAGAGCASS